MISLSHLLKLRLVVARYGEMDMARWWNTQGMLGRYGAIALERGFPRTHHFAQARVVFAVARSRSEEVFNAPGSMTLWHLPADLEDRFDTQWHSWLDETSRWAPFFSQLASMRNTDLLGIMHEMGLVTGDQADKIHNLRRSAEGRSVPLSGIQGLNDEILTLLAAGFSRGEPGRLAVPYARLESGA